MRSGIRRTGGSPQPEALRPKRQNQIPLTSVDNIVSYLEDTYPQKCIGRTENEIDAHRYAAKVEAAETLIALIKRHSKGEL